MSTISVRASASWAALYGRYIIERESPYTSKENPDADFFAAVLSSAAAAGPATSANRAINANSTEQSFVVSLVCFIFYFVSLIGSSVNWEQRIVSSLTLFAHVRLLLIAGRFRRGNRFGR